MKSILKKREIAYLFIGISFWLNFFCFVFSGRQTNIISKQKGFFLLIIKKQSRSRDDGAKGREDNPPYRLSVPLTFF